LSVVAFPNSDCRCCFKFFAEGFKDVIMLCTCDCCSVFNLQFLEYITDVAGFKGWL
jgi:hypothetical protein